MCFEAGCWMLDAWCWRMNDEQLKCLFAAHFFKSLILAATILLPLLQPNDAPREVKRPQDNKTTGVKSITATSFSTTANANNAPTKILILQFIFSLIRSFFRKLYPYRSLILWSLFWLVTKTLTCRAQVYFKASKRRKHAALHLCISSLPARRASSSYSYSYSNSHSQSKSQSPYKSKFLN